ncbi:MAG: UDP-N-acetylmuramate dehydrogenase [Myxococcales bacterium]|nr:UDP-N-acetylmuramate dehydrogenase [Myxococcales bacterium]
MRIHMTAIGGTGMGALAGLLGEAGHEVRGSDGPLYPPMSTLLAELGVPLFEGYAASNLDWDPDLVVIGNTCKSDHVELLAARERDLRCVSFPQLLGEMFLAERWPVVVAGTHGKTTTTSLMAHVLRHAGIDPGYLIGGIPVDFGRSFALGSGEPFVVEGDEYDSACFDKRPKFVHYAPRTAIVTSIELDHVDIYDGIEDIERAFAALVAELPDADAPNAGHLVVCAGSRRAIDIARTSRARVERYMVVEGDETAPPFADWIGRRTVINASGRQRIEVMGIGGESFLFELPMVGTHNAENALAVALAARGLGLSTAEIAAGLASFGGVKRRQELRALVGGIAIVDDFAHHPTAVARTLEALRGVHGDGRLVAVYEPRSSTSRRNVMQGELVTALREADIAVIAPVYNLEALPEDERLDRDSVAAALETRGTTARCPADVASIVTQLRAELRSGDTVVVMSSGGFESLIPRLIDALEQEQ